MEEKKITVRLDFDAHTGTIAGRVGTFKKSEHVENTWVRALGVPEPVANVTIDELSPEARAALDLVCAEVAEHVCAKVSAALADPAAVVEMLGQIAARERSLVQATNHATEEIAKRQREAQELDAAIATKRGELAKAEADAKKKSG